MKTKKPAPTISDISSSFRNINLERLNNRLAGKSLVDFEHCLIECLGELQEHLRVYIGVAKQQVKYCKDASGRDEFLSCYRHYRKERTSFGSEFSICTPVGEYFDALKKKLMRIEEKHQEKAGGDAAVTHARILVVLICDQIDRMWFVSSQQNEKVEQQLWEYWMARK